jgi:hypothetical protein
MTVHIDRSLWLPETEYFPGAQKKTGIAIHHTVGGSACSTVRAQKDVLLGVDSLRLVIGALQDSVTRLQAANAMASVAFPVATGPFTTPGCAFTTATRTSTSVECTITTPISTFTSAYGLFTPLLGTRATGCCKRTWTWRRRTEGSGKPTTACCKRTSTLRRRTEGSGKPAAACCRRNIGVGRPTSVWCASPSPLCEGAPVVGSLSADQRRFLTIHSNRR